MNQIVAVEGIHTVGELRTILADVSDRLRLTAALERLLVVGDPSPTKEDVAAYVDAVASAVRMLPED